MKKGEKEKRREREKEGIKENIIFGLYKCERVKDRMKERKN